MSFFKVSVDVTVLVGVEARSEAKAKQIVNNIPKSELNDCLIVDGDIVIGDYVALIDPNDEDNIHIIDILETADDNN